MATVRAKAMNNKVLEWARKEAGLSQAQLASLVNQKNETFIAWEEGKKYPTILQLEKLADILKRPLAIFFFSEVPSIKSPQKDFRMLPEPMAADQIRDTAYAIREAHARQLSILELCNGENPAGKKFLFKRQGALGPDVVRRILGILLSEQVKWGSPDFAFNQWRAVVESVGIVVFKRSFKQMAISGFCLPHAVAPIIVINNGTSWTRQTFTLMHELGHLARRHHGVTRADNGYLDMLEESEQAVERECNIFAARLLVPEDESSYIERLFFGREEDMEPLAVRYSVSREVVLRRLHELGKVDQATYELWTGRWNSGYYARKQTGKKGGGNYYSTQASYLGPTFLRLAFSAHMRNHISVSELAEHLGMKAKNIIGLEPFVGAA